MLHACSIDLIKRQYANQFITQLLPLLEFHDFRTSEDSKMQSLTAENPVHHSRRHFNKVNTERSTQHSLTIVIVILSLNHVSYIRPLNLLCHEYAVTWKSITEINA